MKRAFTLIELLVVIAIIAILAAILFPVFAQAKEAAKKTATLAQYKQVGTGAQIYLSDNDDLFPLSMAPWGTGWRNGYRAPVPVGWTTYNSYNVEPGRSESAQQVLNSLQPYLKNNQLFAGTGLPTFDYGVPQVAGAPGPALVNLSFNGMLHAWSGTAIAQVSRLPMLSPTHMKQNLKGFSISSPMLDCQWGPSATTNACRFAPDVYPSGSAGPINGGAPYGYAWWGLGSAGNFTLWQYGRGMCFVASDTSAKHMNFNAPMWPLYAENVNTSPWSAFDPAGPPGSPYWMTDCVSPGGTKGGGRIYYPGYYRPDSEYSWTLQQCDFGGG